CMAHVSFTNLKCDFKNASFGKYEQCHIKAVNRSHKYVSVYAKLYILPLSNITVSIFKPYFVDLTFDVCQYLKNRRNVLVNVFFNVIERYSNINHTCPYNHDIIVDKLWTGNHDDMMSKYFPITSGQYALFMDFFLYKMHMSQVVIYLKISN
ncbi:hypothetical protein KR093_007001, partial [Drosophila rubida]